MLKRAVIAACPWLPGLRLAAERGHWRELAPMAAAVGWPAALRLWFALRCQAGRPARRLARLRPTGFERPVHFRPGGSDARVIEQVFVHREYRAVAHLPGVEFIADCGANIGCTTFYLLHRYPRARAVVVEPDAGNMAVCRRNLAPFGARVTYLEAGVWSSSGPLVVERGAFGDGAEWSFQVRPARPGERPDVTAVTVPEVMARAGFPRLDLLKVDVEGAEAEVFGPGAGAWLPRVRNLAIELHGPACERALAAALAGFRFRAGTSGELTVLTDLAPAVAEGRC